MDRQPRRSSCGNQESVEHQRTQTSRTANVRSVYKNVSGSTICRTTTAAGADNILDLSHDPSRSPDAALEISAGDEQFHRISRTLSFVTAPRVHHPVTSRPHGDAPSCLPRPSLDTSAYVLVRYTNLSVSPDGGAPRIEAATRTLNAIGYGPSPLPSCGTGGIVATDADRGAPALGIVGMNGLPASMQQIHGPSFLRTSLALSSTSALAATGRSCHVPVPATSTVPCGIPGRYPPVPPAYHCPVESSLREEPSSLRPASMQGGHQPHLRMHVHEPGDRYVDRTLTQRSLEEQQLQQLRLQQMQRIHQYHEHQSNQQFAPPSEQFARDQSHKRITHEQANQHMVREQSNQRFRQHMRYPQSQTHLNQHGLPSLGFVSQSQHHQVESVRRSLTVPGVEPAMSAPMQGSSRNRVDCVPATPATPATCTTQPISASPSSPENNGSSSNGSLQRDFACQYPGCSKTFDRRYNLTVHYRRHTDEMPYPCKFAGCPQKFKWRSSQSHHMKTRHQIGSGSVGRNGTNRIISNRTSENGGGMEQHVTGAVRAVRYPQTSRVNDGSGTNGASLGHVEGGDVAEMTEVGEDVGGHLKVGFSPKKRARVQSRNAGGRR